MRLDKYLKISRIIKRRTLAQEACEIGKVFVNGKPAKASYQVKPDDIIELDLKKPIKIQVIMLKESTKKEDALTMYKNLG